MKVNEHHIEEITAEDLKKMDPFDQVYYIVEESLKTHKGFKSQYINGSRAALESTLSTIEKLKELNK